MIKPTHRIVIAGAGYAGLHVALRLGSWLERHRDVEVTLIDRHDYHQVLTELPRVVAGTRADNAVRIRYNDVLSPLVRFLQAEISGIDQPRQAVQTTGVSAGASEPSGAGSVPYTLLVLALGSRPNDFQIPGLADHVLFLWSADDALRVWGAVNESVRAAAAMSEPGEQRRLLTVVIGGAGATGVELAGGLAEELPELARRAGALPEIVRVILVESGPTILAGSSPELIARAGRILTDLGVDIRTNAAVAEAIPGGFRLTSGALIEGGVFIWAGGVKAPEFTRGSGLPAGYNGRIKVDQSLRVFDHSEIFVAGDFASVIDPETGRSLPPLAQIALAEAETVVWNLKAVVTGQLLRNFDFHDKGFVVSVGGRRGVADLAGLALGGRTAAALKDAIEWEYRQSVKHLRGWSPV